MNAYGRFPRIDRLCVCVSAELKRIATDEKVQIVELNVLAATKTICINAFGWMRMNNSSILLSFYIAHAFF